MGKRLNSQTKENIEYAKTLELYYLLFILIIFKAVHVLNLCNLNIIKLKAFKSSYVTHEKPVAME